MHNTMSSYNHAAYPPSVSHQDQNLNVLHQYRPSGSHFTPERLSARTMQKPKVAKISKAPCNSSYTIMPDTNQPSGTKEKKSTIADLVRSDEQFLDLLEAIHYLTFSDTNG